MRGVARTCRSCETAGHPSIVSLLFCSLQSHSHGLEQSPAPRTPTLSTHTPRPLPPHQ